MMGSKVLGKIEKKIRDGLESVVEGVLVRQQAERDALIAKALDRYKVEPSKGFSGLYQMGQADPVRRHHTHTAFSGVDVRVSFHESPENWHPNDGGRCYTPAQAVSWTTYHGGDLEFDTEGTLIDLVLDSADCPQGTYMTVFGANEYGHQTILIQVQDFEVIKTSSGISIDDIVMEQNHSWRGKFYYSGAPYGNRQEAS